MQLTFPPARPYLPRWSPDGSQIVFMDVRFDAPWQIYLVPSSGGRPKALMHPDTGETDPTWTADGKSIIFGKIKKTKHMGSTDWTWRLGPCLPSRIPTASHPPGCRQMAATLQPSAAICQN